MGADQEKLTYLRHLASELARQGLTAQVDGSGSKVYLKIANGETPTLNERVRAAQANDGSWCYWWPWGQPIGSVNDLDSVTAKIAAVLRSVEGGS